jgi:hypothetical protein
MAVFPKKFSPARGSDRDRIKALEEHIKYLENQVEHFASQITKKMEEKDDSVKQKQEG